MISRSVYKNSLLYLLVIFINFNLPGQGIDTTQTTLDELTVTGYRIEPAKFASYNISTLNLKTSDKFGSYSLTELLSRQSGISMLSTGSGISKPVIRGLYGNRILILINGLKFDNQQWQDEHGLGLTTMGISKIEIIKGPFGILYGTEALGGVINIMEEQEPADHQLHASGTFTLNTNTLGGLVNYGLKKLNNHSWWRIIVGMENNADYTDGNNKRVSNSRFDAYHIKSSYGFLRKKWRSVCNLSSSFNRSGFIFNDLDSFLTKDNRWSRSFQNNPAHYVNLNTISSENTIETSHHSRWQVNVGIQSNSRREDEGGGAISLNMHLLTAQMIFRYEKDLNEKSKMIISHLNSLETNTNYGARKLIPNALIHESNLSVFMERKLGSSMLFENGLGFGEKTIDSRLTPSINDPGREIQPFTKFTIYYNLFSGITYFPSTNFNFKFNISTGVRVANLAELSSNGLHEGIYVYEIGNPNMKKEQLFSSSIFSTYNYHKVSFSLSPFINFFQNYIYLSPTSQDWFGFPIYKYLQQDAYQVGTEAILDYTIDKSVHLELNYSGMISKTKDGNYTPFIPAQKLTPGVEGTFDLVNHHLIHYFVNTNFYFSQNNIYPLEKITPAYTLVNGGVSTKLKNKSHEVNISLAMNNIFNTAYYEHLSRLKNFGLLNMGRNMVLNVKYTM